ncbi:ankyrin repeat-containing domain protein, partial [Baffinella frigidus]
HKHVDTALWLLNNGASVSHHDRDGTLPFHMAAAACEPAVLKKIYSAMQKGGTRVRADVKDQRGQRALHYAAGEGNLEVVRALVEDYEASIHSADDDGITPLLVAAMSGQVEMIKPLIVELGADPNAADDQGYPGHTADDRGMTALHHAAMNGHVSCITALVKLGANVDATLPIGTRLIQGASPLHVAACEGHAECVAKLGASPLHVAACEGHAECVAELVNQGARVDTRDKQGGRVDTQDKQVRRIGVGYEVDDAKP